MGLTELIPLAAAVLVIAFLYGSVGHAGASGYIAVMSLAGIAATTIRPVALVLNIFVAAVGTWQFWRAGHFRWRLFWPFALLSVPMAYVGGYLRVPNHILQVCIGGVLLFSAFRFLAKPGPDDTPAQAPALWLALLAGAGLGFLSGLTGTGGGIFLTPLLLLLHWARTKEAAAASALFILLNSAAGLLGNLANSPHLPGFTWPLLAAALVGGYAGSFMGSRRFAPVVVKRLLACVLVVAGLKLILT